MGFVQRVLERAKLTMGEAFRAQNGKNLKENTIHAPAALAAPL
jgi:hypothetical protein